MAETISINSIKAPQLKDSEPDEHNDHTAEIVDATPDFSKEQDDVVRSIYNHIASLIPQLGKDYFVNIEFPNNDANVVNVNLRSQTKSGDAFVDVVKNYFEEK